MKTTASRTSGRSPTLSGSTLLHAVNNVWEDNNGHAPERGDTAARGIFEGNASINVRTVVGDYKGRLFGAPDATSNKECPRAFGRVCQANAFQSTTSTLTQKDTSFFSYYSGLKIAPAVAASQARKNVPKSAGGPGKIDTSK